MYSQFSVVDKNNMNEHDKFVMCKERTKNFIVFSKNYVKIFVLLGKLFSETNTILDKIIFPGWGKISMSSSLNWCIRSKNDKAPKIAMLDLEKWDLDIFP